MEKDKTNEKSLPDSSESHPLIRDPLTGAYSRELLESLFKQEVDRAQRYGMILSICFIDLDYFKSINDAYGHTRGDQVLREMTDRIYDMIRISDFLFRYGGDEFLLLLPNTQPQEALHIAQRILEKMRDAPFSGDPPLTLSLSIGLASYPHDALNTEDLFMVSDRRTSIAKRRGRSQIVIHDETLPSSLFSGDEETRLIEHEKEIETLQRFFKQLPKANRGVLCVEGESGMGRTRFLTQVVNTARLLGYGVIHLSDYRILQSRPYGTLSTAQGLGPIIPPVDLTALEKAIQTGLSDLKYSGVLITIDNLPRIDYPTFDLLRQWLAFGTFSCQAIAYSTEPRQARTLLHRDLPLREVIELKPLTLDGVRIFLRNLLRWESPDEFIHWLQEQTQGRPSAIQYVLKELVSQGKLQQNGSQGWTIDPTYAAVKLKGHEKNIPNNLPAAVTEFIGREIELHQANARLDRGRLLSIIGPGGIGKTRLALEIATLRLGEFEDGVYLIPLATVMEPQLVPATIVQNLGIKETIGKTLLESLKEYLRDRHMLLVIDSFEQVITAVPILSELLNGAPRLKLVVTSREVLRITGESVYQLPVLSQNAAIDLFVTCAQAVQFDYFLTDENRDKVVQLCEKLDGLPLAIELAAARIREFTPQQMLDQVSRLAFLSVGPRNATTRQRTLRGTIEWGYQLLSKNEQELFMHLGVFIGGATLDAISAVCIVGEERKSSLQDQLQSLVDKSLLSKQELRFMMLATIREYALEQLAMSGKEDECYLRHAEYYLALAEQAESELNGPRQKEWLDRLEQEHLNLRAVLNWAQKSGHVDIGRRLGAALGSFWEIRGHWEEGRTWLETFLVDQQETDSLSSQQIKLSRWAARLAWQQGDREWAISLLQEIFKHCQKQNDKEKIANLKLDLGHMFIGQGDLEQGSVWLEESLILQRELGNKLGIATILQDLGWIASYIRGDYENAWALCEESLTICQEIGNKRVMARALHHLAQIARFRGEFSQTNTLLEEELKLTKELDDKDGIARSIFSLAEYARSQQDYQRATNLYKEHLTFCRKLGYKNGIIRSLNDLGELARYQGDYERAADYYHQSFILSREIGDTGNTVWLLRNQAEVALYYKDYANARSFFVRSLVLHRGQQTMILIALCLEGLGAVALGEGQLIRATRLLGAAESLFKKCVAMLAVEDRTDYDRRVAAVRSQLDEAVFHSAWEEGLNLSEEQAIDYALESTFSKNDNHL